MAVLINTDSGLQRLRGNKKLYRRMLQMFLDGPECGRLEDALAGADPAAADAAHTVKGMAGNLSLDALFETSTILMNELRTGATAPAAAAAYRDALAQTRDAARALIAEWEAEAG
ncbi:MAG: Hpt domain-containing protein [Gracilibacteraceae bacterium]|jgi:HPt (histidine-containing phosphotransfer) domain-containing protein|nr:Hpt domain-containing protein [Gracilibacteraceae bacterium]